MSLNATMNRLKEDAALSKMTSEERKRLNALATVEVYWPTEISPRLWNVYRSVWATQKTLRCSRCQMALDGKCQRGDIRKAAKTIGIPCFRPNAALLMETAEIVDVVLKLTNNYSL